MKAQIVRSIWTKGLAIVAGIVLGGTTATPAQTTNADPPQAAAGSLMTVLLMMMTTTPKADMEIHQRGA